VNGEKDRWYVISNGARVGTITEYANGIDVEGEVTDEVCSFVAEIQAANRAERDSQAMPMRSTVSSSIPAPRPAAVPVNLGLRMVGRTRRAS